MDREILVVEKLIDFIYKIESDGMIFKGLKRAYPEFESSSFIVLVVISPQLLSLSCLEKVRKLTTLLHQTTDLLTREQINRIRVYDSIKEFESDNTECISEDQYAFA
jgi:predicted nucleotidyltransferase